MSRASRFTALALAAIVAVAAGVTSAQVTQPPPPDPLVAELRALRMDLAERLDATIRAQLIVARLQLQEQRTNTVVRQLQDVEARLRENVSARAQVDQGMKMFGASDISKLSAEERESPMFAALFAAHEHTQKEEESLKLQQADLLRLVAEEQSRWSTINARLDELEQMFVKRRE